MLTLFAKLFKALNSESSARQIALAIALGFIVGLSPLFSLINLCFLFVVLLIRVHLGSFILSLGLFKGIAYLLSSLIVSVGEYLLTSPALNELFTGLYQSSFFKLAHLNHTYVLGALVVGLLLAVPIYLLAHLLIVKYRVHIKAFIERFQIVRALKTSNFYRIYSSISGQGSAS